MDNHLGGFPVSEATATNRARDPLNGPGDLSINSPLSLISKDLKGKFILSLKVMIIIPIEPAPASHHLQDFAKVYNLYLASGPLRDKLTLSPLSPSAASNFPKKLHILRRM
jgi:hypothetical protein